MAKNVPDEYIETARALVEERYSDVRAWIVGSRLDGDPRPDSDLDVVVETVPTHRKHADGEPRGQVSGAGFYVEDTGLGFPVDITEDEDGPIHRSEESQLRIL